MGDSKSRASLTPAHAVKASTASQIRPLKPIAFGRYELLGRLRLGGMAELYRARECDGAGRIVAIKRILPSFTDEADYVAMFADEARLALRLKHPGVVEAFEIGQVEDELYIALEYVHGNDGGTLLRRAREQKQPLPCNVACRIALEVCAALGYAHALRDEQGRPLGIVHRDVSPQNILISYDGDVKLIDFGIAKSTDQLMRTQAGLLKGKHGYLSPEQACGYELDRRSDLFSLAICLYEMLTAERVFQGASDFSTLARVRRAQVAPIRERNPQVPERLAAIVHRALAHEPGSRFESAEAMGRAIAAFARESGAQCDRDELARFMRETFPEGIDPAAQTESEAARDPSTGLLDAFDDLEPPSVVSSLAASVLPPAPRALAPAPPLFDVDDDDDEPLRESSPLVARAAERPGHDDETTRVVDYESTARGEIADEPTLVAVPPTAEAPARRASTPSDLTRPRRRRPTNPEPVPQALDWDEEELSTHVYDEPPRLQPFEPAHGEPVAPPPASTLPPQLVAPRPRSDSRPFSVPASLPPPGSLRPQRSTHPVARVSLPTPPARRAAELTIPPKRPATRVLAGLALTFLGAFVGVWIMREPEPSRLRLSVVPADASIRLDDVTVAAGSSPFLVSNIKPDVTHRIEVHRQGYRSWQTQLALQPGKELMLPPIELVPEAQAPRQGVPAVAPAPEPAPLPAHQQGQLIRQDAPAPAPTPTTDARPALKAQHPRAAHAKPPSLAKQPAPKAKPIARDPHPNAPLSNPSSSAILRVNSRPWSRVYVDGRLVGTTPQMNLVLRAGSHNITLVNPDFNLRKVLTVQLKSGETATQIVTLE